MSPAQRDEAAALLRALLVQVEVGELTVESGHAKKLLRRLEGAVIALEADPALVAHPHRAPVREPTVSRTLGRMIKRQRNSGEGARAVGYLRVSTDEQADSGAGLAAQRAAVEAEATRRGWHLTSIEVDAGVSGKSLAGRPHLAEALAALSGARADVLVVAKLDRLSRSLLDFAALMARSQQEGWSLVALDLGVDTSTPAGEFMAAVMASAAQWERRIIGQRTREALSAKRAQGVRLGRPASIPPAVVARIGEFRRDGMSVRAIAERLTVDGVPTVTGAERWSPSTVQRVLASGRAAEERRPSTR